jgi:hypothetical protein
MEKGWESLLALQQGRFVHSRHGLFMEKSTLELS